MIQPDGRITLNPRQTHQTMDGFGASACWWAQDVGGWEDDKRQRIIRLLFGRETGIGLAIYRYNIGGGAGHDIADPWRRAETFEVAEGVYDWSRDANAVWVMKAAQAAGAERFIAFANSPQARVTVSGLTTGEKDGQSNLRPDMVDQFARYLVDVTRHLRDDLGIPVGWISPINEPQWPWSRKNGQEGCHYTVDEVVTVTRALLRALREGGLGDVAVSVFDSAEWKTAPVTLHALMADADVAPALHHLAVHSYWSQRDDKEPLAALVGQEYPGVSLWMTEWTEMQEGRDYGMESALVLANTIHEDLTVGGVVSWQYWIAVSCYDYRDGLIYVNPADRTVEETKRLWAMGNFSRFVRPDFVRVAAGASADDLKVVAFRSPEGQHTVLVAINNAGEAHDVALEWGDSAAGEAAIYETSAAHDLALVYTGASPARLVFPAQSVTTVVRS